jgi:hypothetical protein
MARNSRNSATAALVALTVAVAGAQLSAHRLDEYLQAARVAIDPVGVTVELDMTAGVAVADRVLADIDRDRDGRISPGEAQAYVDHVVGALAFDVDGVPLATHVTGAHFPEVDAIRAGEGTIRIDLAAHIAQLTAGAHHFHYRNTHRGDISVYMANALVPSDDRVQIADQERDGDQRTLDVAYVLADRQASWMPRLLVIAFVGALVIGFRQVNL